MRWVGPALLAAILLPPAHAQTQPTHYTVLLDAAHGAPETGARLTDQLNEKDLTLSLSVRLRSILTAHGIQVVTTRETDINPPLNTRAAAANRAHAAACLLLHATTGGTGVHVYTSALAPAAPRPALPGRPAAATVPTSAQQPALTRSPTAAQPESAPPPVKLRPWATAQAAYLTQSLKLSSDISEALHHAAIPVTLGSISLAPIDNMACPAVILELAPLLPSRTTKAAPLTDPAYQTRLVDALAGALEQWRTDWNAQP